MIPDAAPPPTCPWAMVERIDRGYDWRGPLFINGGHITFELTPGMRIEGEWIMKVCAGPDGVRIEITKP